MTRNPDTHQLRPRLGTHPSFFLLGSILVSFLAASSAPSPLYPLYREAMGFSAMVLTVVFASYALALLAALLMLGSLSDVRGRRQVILAALAIEMLSMVVFVWSDNATPLILARILQGVATGLATSAVGAGLLDISRERGAWINSVAPMIGLAIGALGTSALVQFAPAPMQLVYSLLLTVFLVQAVLTLAMPETASRQAFRWASLVPKVAIPAAARRTFLQLLPINTAQWAHAGFALSLGPSLTRSVTGVDDPIVTGLVIAVLMGGSALAMAFVRRRPPRPSMVLGAAALASGIGLSLIGIVAPSTTLYVAGSALAGAGFGSAFSGSMRSLVPLAAPTERAALVAGFMAVSYIAFSLPAIAGGFVATAWGLTAAAVGYSLVLVAMTVGALVVLIRSRSQAGEGSVVR